MPRGSGKSGDPPPQCQVRAMSSPQPTDEENDDAVEQQAAPMHINEPESSS